MESGAAELAGRLVKVQIDDDRVEHIDCFEGGDAVRTFGALVDKLIRKGRVSEDHVLSVVPSDGAEEWTPEPTEDLPLSVEDLSAAPVIRFRRHTFWIKVKDGETVHEVRVSASSSVKQVKESYLAQYGRSVPRLSLDGVELQDSSSLKDARVVANDTLVGQIKIIVRDAACRLDTPVVGVYDFLNVGELKRMYTEQARRTPAAEATLMVDGQLLSDEQILHDCHIKDLDIVDYANPPYGIFVKTEMAQASSNSQAPMDIPLTVEDHMTVAELRVLFQRESRQGLLDGDKIIFGDSVLENDKMLYEYRIAGNSVLTISRENASIALTYECAGKHFRLDLSDSFIHAFIFYRVWLKCTT